MPSVHKVRAWIACEPEEWRRFIALATLAGSDGARMLAQLIRGELSRQGVQLVLEVKPRGPAKARKTGRSRDVAKAPPAKRTRKPWAPAGKPGKGAVRPVKARRARSLPTTSDALVEREARAGAAAAKRSRRRGTIASEGADSHDATIAKANKRSRPAVKGRPTRRRK